LYKRPAPEFTPLLYNPLFFYLSALVTALAGPGFVGPRLISILATIGCCWLIFVLVRRETGSTLAAAAAAAFYAATFKATGAWMDVGRSDSLLVFFILLAAFVARRMTQSSRWGALVCALCLALAYFSKQSALPFFVAFGGFYLLERRREWLVYYPAAALFTLGTTWLVDKLSDGWFSFYTWYVVRQTVLDAERIRALDRWTVRLCALALIGAVGALALLKSLSHLAGRLAQPLLPGVHCGRGGGSWWNRAAAAHTKHRCR
jgi:hypothetical protein